MTYAAGTTVSVDRSKNELDAILGKHKATQRGVMTDDDAGMALVVFTLDARQYRLEVPLPKRGDFATKPARHRYGYPIKLTPERQRKAHDQACRERWRAVVLLVKAKLELVAIGVSTVEREFLADLVLPNGARVHAALFDGIKRAYETGTMTPLLGTGGP